MNMRLTVAAATATVLASIALYPLLASGTWFWAGIGTVGVVSAVGAATRRRAIPVAVCFLAGIGAEFLYLNAVFAARQSLAGLVPTGASLHALGVLVSQAMAETSKYAPPVPPRPGIMLVTVAGIGLVGVLTDLLAVRLHRPAIAGLPLLVLFCVPLTTDASPGAVGGTLVFCAGMVGYLGLLSADGRHRLRLWGRLIHPWQDDGDGGAPDIRPLAAAGRRIGSAAVVLAVALPLLVPGLKAHRLFPGSGGGGTGHGGHTRISFPRPLDLLNADLHRSRPVTVLNYRTSDFTPPYLRVYVLATLTPDAWKMGPPAETTALTRHTLPRPPGLNPTTPASTVHEVISLSRNLTAHGHGTVSYLPLPYPDREVWVRGAWQVDAGTLAVLSAGARLAGLRYAVTAEDLNPSVGQLRHAAAVPAGMAGYLAVPDSFRTPTLLRLAKRITADNTTPFGKAVALQRWFTAPGHFTYSLNVGQSEGPSALEQFLTRTKRGYCQQFAFAMAVLARLLGIPSRVAIGYTQGTYTGGHSWQVKTSDAHAWPELYFPGSGWLRFEPTPPDQTGGLPGQATATAPLYSDPRTAQSGVSTTPGGGSAPGLPGSVPKSSRHPGKSALGAKLRGPNGALTGPGGARRNGSSPLAPVVFALLAVMAVAPATMRAVARRRVWWRARDDAARAHAAWSELRHDLTDHRIAYRASESPRALTRRVASSLGLAGAEREAIERIAAAEERASYASRPADSARLRADVTRVRRAVARASSRPARWSARLVPPSALIPLRDGLGHLLDVFGWIELATTLTRRRITPRRGTAAPA